MGSVRNANSEFRNYYNTVISYPSSQIGKEQKKDPEEKEKYAEIVNLGPQKPSQSYVPSGEKELNAEKKKAISERPLSLEEGLLAGGLVLGVIVFVLSNLKI